MSSALGRQLTDLLGRGSDCEIRFHQHDRIGVPGRHIEVDRQPVTFDRREAYDLERRIDAALSRRCRLVVLWRGAVKRTVASGPDDRPRRPGRAAQGCGWLEQRLAVFGVAGKAHEIAKAFAVAVGLT